MANLIVSDENLEVELSPLERLGALRRAPLRFPLANVRSVERVDGGMSAVRGWRMPGTGLPGVIALGTWRTRNTVDFVAVARNAASYVVELEGQKFDRLIVSCPANAAVDAVSR